MLLCTVKVFYNLEGPISSFRISAGHDRGEHISFSGNSCSRNIFWVLPRIDFGTPPQNPTKLPCGRKSALTQNNRCCSQRLAIKVQYYSLKEFCQILMGGGGGGSPKSMILGKSQILVSARYSHSQMTRTVKKLES